MLCNTCDGKSKGKCKCPCYLKCDDELGFVDLNTFGGGVCISVDPTSYDVHGRAVFQARDFQWVVGSGFDGGENPPGQLVGSITNPYPTPMLAKVEMRFRPDMVGAEGLVLPWLNKTITFHAMLSNNAAAPFPGNASINILNPAVITAPLTNGGVNLVPLPNPTGVFSQSFGTAVLYKQLAVGETWNYYSGWWATFHEAQGYPDSSIVLHGHMMVSEYGSRNHSLTLPAYLVGA